VAQDNYLGLTYQGL